MATLALATVQSLAAFDHGGKNDTTDEVRLRARLTGAAIAGKTPEGSADFRNEPSRSRSRLDVDVEQVNLPAGTVLTVTLTHAGATTTIGSITLNAFGGGELDLNSQDGDVVPAIVAGDVITVLNGTAAVLVGSF
jgi:hypothetical protein